MKNISALNGQGEESGIHPAFFDDPGQAGDYATPHDLAVHFEQRGSQSADAAPGVVRYGLYDSDAIGPFMIAMAGDRDAICYVMLSDDEAACRDELRAFRPQARLIADAGAGRDYAARMDAYWRGAADSLGNIPLCLTGTPFQLNVWRALLNIPIGACVSYGAIARAAGKPGAARAIGSAVAANPVALLVPCHRVVRGGGHIGGYAWGHARKQHLLAMEARVTADRAQAGA